jgi:uncharacterized tellurite resistance protein B-like protein
MTQKTAALNLGKLIIAAAWADGKVDPQEVNVLKRLLLDVPGITAEDWRELELYLDHPVSQEEMDALLRQVLDGLGSREDKTWVLSTLKTLIEADGVVTPEEAALYAAVESAVEAASTGVLAALGRLVGRAARGLRGQGTALREQRMEDFLVNPLYFRLSRPGDDERGQFSRDDDALRTVCLATALMARMARADGVPQKAEEREIRKILVEDWSLSDSEADRLWRAARELKRLDVYRLGEQLRQRLDEPARGRLLAGLFRVARASQGIDEAEEADLRKMATCLGLGHRQFIAAKTRSSGTTS